MTNTSYNLVNDNTIRLFFDAFGNMKRFKILAVLKNDPMSVSRLQKVMNCEQSDISHNLQCLLNCGFVSKKINGKERIYYVNEEAKPIISAVYKHINKYEKYLISCNIMANPAVSMKNR